MSLSIPPSRNVSLPTLTILGAGNLGGRVLARHDGDCIAVTRTTDRHPRLRSLGARVRTTPPSTGGWWVLSVPGSQRQLEALATLADIRPERVVLVSSTGLHHPYAGAISSESEPSSSQRSMVVAELESRFWDWAGDRGCVVRLGGLWHATRGPFSAFARKRSAPLGPPDALLPLIHYDDAAALVYAALHTRDRCLLGVTSAPTREAFYGAAAGVLGCEPPVFADPIGGEARFEAHRAHALAPPIHADWRAMFGGRA